MKVGDKVTRLLAESIPMKLTITAIDEEFIHCGGGWKFDKITGAEVDEFLGWGNERTGSYLTELRKDGGKETDSVIQNG